MILGLDLGTAHLGVVVAAAPVLPLRILDARKLDIDKNDLGPVADWVRAGADANATDGVPPDLVVEFGALYIPAGASEQKARAIAENHSAMKALLVLIWQACPGPFYRVETIARRTWSARVLPAHQGGITNAEASAALAPHVDPAGRWPLLSDQHRRDAAGAIVGHLLGSPGRGRRIRAHGSGPRPLLTAEERIAHRRAAVARHLAKNGAATAAAASAGGCTCGPDGAPRPIGSKGRHRAACPVAPPPKVRGSSSLPYVPTTRKAV